MTAAADEYVTRQAEEAAIQRELAQVRADGTSRAVLLLGSGGTGKTMLVRHLAAAPRSDDRIRWVRPIDVDDSEYWLLSNLESAVADSLDHGGSHFERYFERLGRIGRYGDAHVGYETVLTQLGRINRTFIDCYREFVQATDTTVVITLDTIEAVRSMYLLLTLTQWMKELPNTLFVLSGRPPGNHEPGDALREELSDRHRPLEHVEVRVAGFADEEARRFLDASPVCTSITEAERDRLIDLTSGQPLWLALAVEYLQLSDPPAEMAERTVPTEAVRESFRRRLVARYRRTDFWPEAIRRLAVVRHSVTQQVWSDLMADRGLPADASDWDDAWAQLLRRPWVRTRANERYVTLHDALAEELSQRLIPLHDQDGNWRAGLWGRARRIYAALTAAEETWLDAELARLDRQLETGLPADDNVLVLRVAAVDAAKRELDQLMTAQLHYAVLDDFGAGTERFLELCQRAEKRRDPLFMELICHEMENFLPRPGTAGRPENVLDLAVAAYRRWLRDDEPQRHVAVAVEIAGFLIRNEQPEQALDLLGNLPEDVAIEIGLRYRLANERGNACMRVPGRVHEARDHFQDALRHAGSFDGESERVLGEAQAHKELGFYLRNVGNWPEADDAYHTARDVLATMMGPGSQEVFRREMASIQTNWAYLKALRGSYRDARNLVDSAIAIRRRFDDRHGVGVSLSVSGEVHRYEGKFSRAWDTYREAEVVFQETRSWPWLGILYQEMAICLHQAGREGVDLIERQAKVARELVDRALDICRESNSRAYPSALNRAGRIFSADGDVDAGLERLEEGAHEARRIGDGWFLSANLIEYVEYAYRAWTTTGAARYRALIDTRGIEIAEVSSRYKFRDMAARWELLQGHLLTNDALEHREWTGLDSAVKLYSKGFQMLADESVGSHGAAAVAREFVRFRKLFERLPTDIRTEWYRRLRQDWNAATESKQSTSLLARLEELY